MHADTQEASSWWARPRGPQAPAWVATYQKSLTSRHRTAIMDVLQEIQPQTLLEVGCHCGPNLIRAGQLFPALKMHGIDINADAVDAGRTWAAAERVTDRLSFHVGRVPDLTSALPSGSYDVVLSCYALAYIAPADLDAVLYELGRLSAKAIVIAEPMALGTRIDPKRSLSGYSEWAHDYREAARWVGSWHGRTIRIVPVTPPVDRLNGILVAA